MSGMQGPSGWIKRRTRTQPQQENSFISCNFLHSQVRLGGTNSRHSSLRFTTFCLSVLYVSDTETMGQTVAISYDGEDVSPELAARNEQLAVDIQKQWAFKLRRIPANTIITLGIVNIVLIFLNLLLLISNNFYYFGFWEAFTKASMQYRDSFRDTDFARAAYLNLFLLDPYSLWRGWVVPSFLAGGVYVFTALLTLRHELYHWKPELLQHYFDAATASSMGRWIPRSWMDTIFKVYTEKHQRYASARIQKRKHKALGDSEQLLKVIRTVGLNLLISVLGVLALWIALLLANVDAENIVKLPRSYVPPIQGAVWYLFNDFFYFYPHWIAHKNPATAPLYSRLLPRALAERMHKLFNQSHKLHHQTKANLGIAAWYCSPTEQVLFNLFPAFAGPVATQFLADRLGVADTWGTHVATLYVWLTAAASSSVLAHTGYRSRWNDPGKHDLHHERAFNPKTAVNFGTLGFFDWLHGTSSSIAVDDTRAWRAQHDRQAALWEASRRTGIPLTKEQTRVVQQPDHGEEWVGKGI